MAPGGPISRINPISVHVGFKLARMISGVWPFSMLGDFGVTAGSPVSKRSWHL